MAITEDHTVDSVPQCENLFRNDVDDEQSNHIETTWCLPKTKTGEGVEYNPQNAAGVTVGSPCPLWLPHVY